jgi:hypothetical protein
LIILILLLSQRATGRREGKEPAVSQQPPPEEDPFDIDFGATNDPIGSIRNHLKKISREIVRLAGIRPTTPEIKDRAAHLVHTLETLKVSINEIFNYNKSSIMVFMLCSFMALIKIWMRCLYRVFWVIPSPIPVMRVLQVVQVDCMFHSPLVFSTEYI